MVLKLKEMTELSLSMHFVSSALVVKNGKRLTETGTANERESQRERKIDR